MRQRLLVAMVSTVAAALVLTGAGTIALSYLRLQSSAESDARADAAAVVDTVVAGLINRRIDPAKLGPRLRALRALRARLHASGLDVVGIGPLGKIRGSLPSGVSRGDVHNRLGDLRDGEVISGRHGRLAWAAAPSPASLRRGILVVVSTRQVPLLPRGVVPWFLVSGGVVLAVAVLVSLRVSSRITRPLRQASGTARRIASGDLAARVAEPPPGHRDELAELARAINAMAAGLERSRAVERQFLLSVSHDLRTPLTSIRGYAEAISDGTATDQRAAAGVILGESRRLERLVADLLLLARLDARQFTVHPEVVELSSLVHDAAEAFRPEVEESGLQLVVDDDPSLPHALADRDRIAQMVSNLVENALKFAGTAVRVSTVSSPASVGFAVADDGPGIAPDDLDHVFERLYVAKARPARKESGSGLGLAIVRELATAMGGTATVERLPTRGTRFTVWLPPAIRPSDAAAPLPAS